MTQGLREARLGREGDQDADGVHRAPIAGSPSTDNVRELPAIKWSDLNAYPDTTGDGVQGKLYNESGYGLGILTAGSDPNTLVSVAFGDSPNYVHLEPGTYIRCPSRFDRFLLKISSTLPNTANSFKLVTFQTKEANAQGYFSSRAANVGAALWAILVSTFGNTPTNVAPARSTRWRVVLKNQGPNDVYLGPSAAVSVATGELLAAGGDTVVDVNADVYGISPAGTTVLSAREEYS